MKRLRWRLRRYLRTPLQGCPPFDAATHSHDTSIHTNGNGLPFVFRFVGTPLYRYLLSIDALFQPRHS
jgi:hypothetical protein